VPPGSRYKRSAALRRRPMHSPVIQVILVILDIYFWIIVAAVVASWLVAFGIINAYNPVARQILMALRALTEPVFRRVRKVVPIMGGLDLSPMIVILLLWAVTYAINYYAFKYGY
jgi:YggT family protein